MTPQLRRPLSPQERWYWIANQVSPLNVIARVRLHGKISHDLLEAAAAALAAEYPVLRVAITADADGTNPSYLPSARPVEVRTVSGDDAEWQRQVDSYELATSLDWHTGPLVRIVHVAGNSGDVHDLVLTGSHIIVDGFTVISLMLRLLEHADRLGRSPGDTQTISRPAVGAPEDRLPARYRGARGFARIAGSVIADGLATAITRPRRLRAETPVPASQRRTRLLCRNLSGSQVDGADPALPCRRRHRTRRTGGGHGDGDRTGSRAERFRLDRHHITGRLPRRSGSPRSRRRSRCLRVLVDANSALRRWPGSMVDRPAVQPVDAPTRPIRSASRGAERCAVRGPRLARHQRARHWPDGTPRCYLQYLPDERLVASTSQRGSANGPCPAGRARVAYRSAATLWRRSVRFTANYFGISPTSTGLCRSRPRSSSRTLLAATLLDALESGGR